MRFTRCAKVVPQGTFSCPSGNSPCVAPAESKPPVQQYAIRHCIEIKKWEHTVLPYGRKNPLPFPYFAAVTCRQSAPDHPRERGDTQEGGNRRCLPSCAPARRQRRLSTLLCPCQAGKIPFASQATLCRTASERKRGTLLTRSVPLCAYYWFLFS